MGNGGGAISAGGLQSSMSSNAGYPMLKCYSCHAQWTLDSNNDCVKTKATTSTTDCASLSCESITISFQTASDTNILYYAWRGCTHNPEDGIDPNSIVLNPTEFLEQRNSKFQKFQDLNIYVQRSIQPGVRIGSSTRNFRKLRKIYIPKISISVIITKHINQQSKTEDPCFVMLVLGKRKFKN